MIFLPDAMRAGKCFYSGVLLIAYETPLPTTKTEAVNYLKSLRCGIGRLKARKLYECFGESLWDVVEHSPERLTEVPGITEKIVQKLIKKMDQTKTQWALMKLFRGKLEVSTDKLKKLKEYFKENTLEVATKEPYKLCKVHGFSFPAVDKYALQSGFAFDAKERFFVAMPYIFDMYAARGHVCVPKEDVLKSLVTLLNKQNEGTISEETTKLYLNAACKVGLIHASKGFLYSRARYIQESDIVTRIQSLTSRPANPISSDSIDCRIKEFEQINGMNLAENQRNAIQMVFQNKVSIITGGPGTGKSTITKAILYVYKTANTYDRDQVEPVLLAPTGRAARRLSEVTLHNAATIHSAIQYMGEEGLLEDFHPECIEGELFIIDECSMMDQFICAALLNAVPDDARVVFIGDPDQLPSVGCGNVLQDMINSTVIPVCKLGKR